MPLEYISRAVILLYHVLVSHYTAFSHPLFQIYNPSWLLIRLLGRSFRPSFLNLSCVPNNCVHCLIIILGCLSSSFCTIFKNATGQQVRLYQFTVRNTYLVSKVVVMLLFYVLMCDLGDSTTVLDRPRLLSIFTSESGLYNRIILGVVVFSSSIFIIAYKLAFLHAATRRSDMGVGSEMI